jgi:hypothetical protein
MDTDKVKNCFLSKFSFNINQPLSRNTCGSYSQVITFGETKNDFIKQFLQAPSESMDEPILQSTTNHQSQTSGNEKMLMERNKKIGSSFEVVTLEKEELRHLFKTPIAETVVLVPCEDHEYIFNFILIPCY